MRKALWPALVAAAIVLGGVAYRQSWSWPGLRPDSGAGEESAAHFRHVATIRDVMHMLVEPSSNALFDSVQINVTETGITEIRPETDEDWDALEHHMVGLAEAANLLKMEGRPVAPPEEMNVDPEGPDLSPAAIGRLIERDRARWNRYADGLQDAAVAALRAVRSRDVKALYLVGDTLDNSCDACHETFWYPDEPPADVTSARN